MSTTIVNIGQLLRHYSTLMMARGLVLSGLSKSEETISLQPISASCIGMATFLTGIGLNDASIALNSLSKLSESTDSNCVAAIMAFQSFDTALVLEIDRRVWVLVEKSQAEFVINTDPEPAKKLGLLVTDILPDMREAVNCLTYSLPTAAVFHLMRCVERCVDAISTKLSIVSKAKMLGPKLDLIDAKILEMPASDDKDDWQSVCAYLHAIKDSYRNKTMHPKAFFSNAEANNIYSSCILLFGRLATILT